MENRQKTLDLAIFEEISQYSIAQQSLATINLKRIADPAKKNETMVNHISNIIDFIRNIVQESCGVDIFAFGQQSNVNQMIESNIILEKMNTSYKNISILINKGFKQLQDSDDFNSKSLEKVLNDQVLDRIKEQEKMLAELLKKNEELNTKLEQLQQQNHQNEQALNRQISQRQPQSIVGNLFQPDDSLTVIEAKSFKILQNVIHTNEYNDEGEFNLLFIRNKCRNLLVAGYHNEIYRFSPQLNLIESITIDDTSRCGIRVKDFIYLGQSNQVTVLDEYSFEIVGDIPTQSTVHKLLNVAGDYIICGEWYGFVDVVKLSTMENVCEAKISEQYNHIYDFVETNRETHEYGVATAGGLIFFSIVIDQDEVNFYENEEEVYFHKERVMCLNTLPNNQIITALIDIPKLQIIDRTSKQVIKGIGSFNGEYNFISKIIGYDPVNFPYFIIKDKKEVNILNTKTLEQMKLIDCRYDQLEGINSLVQYVSDGKIKILTHYFDIDTQTRSIKEFTIAEKSM